MLDSTKRMLASAGVPDNFWKNQQNFTKITLLLENKLILW